MPMFMVYLIKSYRELSNLSAYVGYVLVRTVPLSPRLKSEVKERQECSRFCANTPTLQLMIIHSHVRGGYRIDYLLLLQNLIFDMNIPRSLRQFYQRFEAVAMLKHHKNN